MASINGYGDIVKALLAKGAEINSEIKKDLSYLASEPILALPKVPKGAPAAVFKKVILNAKGVFVRGDCQIAINKFPAKLMGTNLFSEVSTQEPSGKSRNYVELTLSVIEKEKDSQRSGAGIGARALFAGLTLGMAPIPWSYGYKSEMTLEVIRWDGKIKKYSSNSKAKTTWLESTDFKVIYKKSDTPAASVQRKVTIKNIDSLLSQIVQDSEFFEKEK